MRRSRTVAFTLFVLVLASPVFADGGCPFWCSQRGTINEHCTESMLNQGDMDPCTDVNQCMPCGGGGEMCCRTYCSGALCMQV
jgi:hypothetical protein